VRRAEAHGELQLRLADVHGNNLARVSQGGAHNHVESDAAAADDGDGAARFDFRTVESCANTGGYGASDHCGLVHGQRIRNRNNAGFRNHRVLSEARDFAHVVNVFAGGVQAGGSIEEIRAGGGVQVAEVTVPFQARPAAAAGGHKGKNHLVAFTRQRHTGTCLHHGSRALMPQHHRAGDGRVAMHEVAVATADAGGPDFHQHLTGFGFIKINLTNIQGLTHFP